VRDHVRKIGRYAFEDLGEQTVKNIAQPIRAFRVRLSDSPGPAEDEAPVGLAAQEQAAAPVAAPSQNTPEFELAFWESIKDGEDPAEFAAYLEKYPGGAFAVLAETRLKALQEQEAAARREPQADEVELAYWDTVKDSDNAEMFRTYLDRYPEGAFAPLAKVRLDELSAADG
jgi:TolA-binding protein